MKRTYVHNPRSCGPSEEVRAYIADLLGEEFTDKINAEINAARAAHGSRPYDFIRKEVCQK